MKLRNLVRGAVIAALYASLCLLIAPASYGAVQFRVSEAMTLLPFIMPEAVWGLTLGCFIANLLGGSVIDAVFGTLATLAAAFITSKIKKIWLLPLPTILINAFVIGAVVTLGTYEFSFPVYLTSALSIGISETVICYVLGLPLLFLVNNILKKIENKSR